MKPLTLQLFTLIYLLVCHFFTFIFGSLNKSSNPNMIQMPPDVNEKLLTILCCILILGKVILTLSDTKFPIHHVRLGRWLWVKYCQRLKKAQLIVYYDHHKRKTKMVRVFLLSIYLASIHGYCFSQNDLGKISTFDMKDTLLEVKTKQNFHYVFPRKIGLGVTLLNKQKKTGLKIIFENHSSSAIWLCENNNQVENGDRLSFYFAPDLSLLSPLYFRKIQPDQQVIYDLNNSKGVKQFELVVAFIGNFELLKKSLIEAGAQSLRKVSGENDLFYAPMSTISSNGLLLFNLQKFSLNGKGRSKIQIINLTSN